MPVRIVNKNSTVQDRVPTAGDLEIGEIAVNANVNSPAAYIKDSAGNIVKLAGSGSVGDDWTRTGTALSPKTAGDTIQFSAGTAALPGITPVGDATTGIYSSGAHEFAIATNATQRLVISSSGQIFSTGLGTAANPALSFVGDTDTGIYSPGANQLAIATSGSERIRIGANGEIGLGGANYGTSGQVLTSSGTGAAVTWVDPGATVTTSDTAPTSPSDGDLWYDSVGGRLYVYYQDPNGSQWVDAAPPSGAGVPTKIEVGNTKAEITDTGSNGAFAVTTEGTQRLIIDSSGRLGLGTSSASYLLDCKGTGATNVARFLTGSTSSSEVAQFGRSDQAVNLSIDYDGAGSMGIGTTTAHPLNLKTGAVTRATIDTSGRVGIGTTSVTGKLSIDGSSLNPISSLNTASNYAVALYGGSATGNGNGIAFCNDNGTSVGGAIIHIDQGSNNVGDLAFYTAATANSPTERARIDSSGRLLVGTSSTTQVSTAVFQGRGSATGSAILRLCTTDATPANGASLGNLTFGDNGNSTSAQISALRDGGTWTSGSSQPTRLTFSTTADGASSPTERMRIKSDGTYDYFTGVSFGVKTARTAATDGAFFVSSGATNIDSGTLQFVVRADGDCENTNNSYGAISDVKLKENIVDANSQWDDLKALRVRNYSFKPETGYSTHTQIGLVAQEAEIVSPGLVSESPDRDSEGSDLGTVTKSVNYSVLYMKAVKALQEAMERIETLEAANTDLAARITALEAN